MADKSRKILIAYTIIILGFVFFPLIMIVILSFNASQNIGLPFTGFSSYWYNGAVTFQGVSGFFTDREALEAMKNSVYLAAIMALVTSLVALSAGLSLRYRYRGRDLLFYAILAGFIVPGVLIGFGSDILYHQLGITPNILEIVPVQLVFALPFGLILLLPRFDTELETYENAAKVLGANGWNVFRYVTFPQIFFQVVGIAIFSFVLSWGELIRTAFVSVGQGTLPVYLFSRLQTLAPTPEFYAMGTIITAVAIIALLAAGFFLTRNQRRLF